jgi:hypothetical protein
MESYGVFGEAQFTMEIPGMYFEDVLVSVNAGVMPAMIAIEAVDLEHHVRVLGAVVRTVCISIKYKDDI